MDSAATAFVKNEERLQKLSLTPSEFVRRQIRVTPYPHEDAGWIVENTGPEVCLFSSDYPHVEGGRNPLARFEASLADVDEHARQRFYCDNFVDLMGRRPPRLRRTVAGRHSGTALRQLRGAGGRFGSLGRPSTRSPTMLRWISAVPPQIVSEREKKNDACSGLTG